MEPPLIVPSLEAITGVDPRRHGNSIEPASLYWSEQEKACRSTPADRDHKSRWLGVDRCAWHITVGGHQFIPCNEGGRIQSIYRLYRQAGPWQYRHHRWARISRQCGPAQ